MTHQTVVLSSYEAYLASENESPEDEERHRRLSRCPYSVMLEVAFPELDFANRWCWQRFGPAHGECISVNQNILHVQFHCRIAMPECGLITGTPKRNTILDSTNGTSLMHRTISNFSRVCLPSTGAKSFQNESA